MPACSKCGADNTEGNRFCLSCGNPISESPAPDPADPSQSLDDLIQAGVVCSKCDTYNDPGQTQCTSCGEALTGLTGYLQAVTDALPSTPAPPAAPERVSEAKAPAAQQVAAPSPATSPDLAAQQVTKTEPQMQAVAMPPPSPPAAAQVASKDKPSTAQMPGATAPAGGKPSAGSAICPHCRATLPAGASVCLACGQRTVAPSTPSQTAADVSIRLRLVRGYGREDATFPIGPGGVTIGREGALISIDGDPFLSPIHLKLGVEGGRLICEDQGSYNGTFKRVRGQADVKQGAEFVSGNHRFVLLGLGGPTTDVRMPTSQDTRAYGGPVPRQLFVALRLNHAGKNHKPLAGSVILRAGPVISIGQKGCDLNFPTDPAMATHQLELHVKPSGIRLVESGASSGVYLRCSGKTALQNGDELLVGDEVFRVEIG